jgi:UDP-glucose 4-epimerase
MKKYILITGGLGYIGSHIADKLLKDGQNVIITDNSEKSLEKLKIHWTTYLENRSLIIYQIDLTSDTQQIKQQFVEQKEIIGVIHCAALKSVPESIKEPIKYYRNNTNSMLNLLEFMDLNNVKVLIFSSSATIYSGNTKKSVFNEEDLSFPTTPYGNTKLIGELILEDLYKSDDTWKIISLRYFNPAVCHLNVDQGDTGLFTAVEKVLTHKLQFLSIFGDDYDTPDGSCVRDYIHINDLVDAHISALQYLLNSKDGGLHEVINIGTGEGCSTLEVAKEFQKNVDTFDYKIVERRSGDAAISIADCEKAKKIIQWSSKYTLTDICRDICNEIQKGHQN